MVKISAFGPVVVARTQAAKYVLERPLLLREYEKNFGKRSDLEAIAAAGERAEAFNSAQGQAFSAGKGATAEVQVAFARLQRTYNGVMAGLSAVIGDLKRAEKPDPAVIAEAGRIAKNEAALHIRITEAEGGKTRKASRSRAQEALRAEIWKDADALLGFTAGKAALEGRGITPDTLSKLKDDAASLAGQLASRTATKAGTKGVTQAERDAIASQKDHWAACYRILARTAADDHSLKSLLKVAQRGK
jgi:hypothetical protein